MRSIQRRWRSWISPLSIIIVVLLMVIKERGRRLTITEILPKEEGRQDTGRILKQFLVPRSPGSLNHDRIEKYIENHFKDLGWQIDRDSFTAYDTPIGMAKFTNLIATYHKEEEDDTNSITSKQLPRKRIILACHYDSKRLVSNHNGEIVMNQFVGAIDSAWSCAFLLHLASELTHWSRLRRQPTRKLIQMIFFDGEEPLGLEWTGTDSLYGSRHLAQQWASALPLVDSTKMRKTSLQDIEFLMLLDLLGAQSTGLANYFEETKFVLVYLMETEKSLRQKGQLWSHTPIFNAETVISGRQRDSFVVEDDHVPFAQKGVPIVHLIPLPFPPVWHTLADDEKALHGPTCHDLALIIKVFLQNYLIST